MQSLQQTFFRHRGKLIDAPLNVIPLTERQATPVEMQVSTRDLIRQGIQLIRDVDPEKAKHCEDALKNIGPSSETEFFANP